MTGSDRKFTYDSFQHLEEPRFLYDRSERALPSGFEPIHELLPPELTEIIEDIQDLQETVESTESKTRKSRVLLMIDNMQASIESRLVCLVVQTRNMGPIVESCRLACYICCFITFAEIWNGSFILEEIANELAKVLLETQDDVCWDACRDLQLWLLCVGGVYAVGPSLQARHEEMLKNILPHLNTGCGSWEDVQDILRTFLWPEWVLQQRAKEVWTRATAP